MKQCLSLWGYFAVIDQYLLISLQNTSYKLVDIQENVSLERYLEVKNIILLKTWIVGTHYKCLAKAVLTGTHNVCFGSKIRPGIPLHTV